MADLQKLEAKDMDPHMSPATRLQHTAPALVFAARKLPSQQRSQASVDAILEAAARILEEGGPLDTNRIAERAGVGIATLYDYFGDRAAVLAALSRKTREELIARVSDCLGPACEALMPEGLRMMVDAALRGDMHRPAMALALDQAEIGLSLDDDHAWSRSSLGQVLAVFLAHHGIADPQAREELADDICAMTGALTAAAQDRGSPVDEALVAHIARRLTPIVRDAIEGIPTMGRAE